MPARIAAIGRAARIAQNTNLRFTAVVFERFGEGRARTETDENCFDTMSSIFHDGNAHRKIWPIPVFAAFAAVVSRIVVAATTKSGLPWSATEFA
jgi:hypothetical protein